MGLFNLFKAAAESALGISVLTNGSDILINRHTKINTFSVNRAIVKHANEVIKQFYLNDCMEDMREEEAAMLKLAVFYEAAALCNEQQMMALIGDSIVKLRSISEGKIRPKISLQVTSQTGC